MTCRNIYEVAEHLRAKVAELEELLLADGAHWRCETCGKVRKESDSVIGRDDICRQCLAESERRRAGEYD
jgi:hypothetical protein